MTVKIESSNEVISAYLEGEMDHHQVRGMREKIDAKLEEFSPNLLILDFSDVTFMDSSGIGLVMGRYRRMQLRGGELKVINTSPAITKVMRLAGLERLEVLEGARTK